MTDLIEDYLRQVAASLPEDPARRRQIVDELRSHLREKTADLERQDPDRPRETIERQVLNEMGSPQELAHAYAPRMEGGRERLLDAAVQGGRRAFGIWSSAARGVLAVVGSIGRGARRILMGIGVALVVLLLLTGGLGVWAWYEVRPYLPTLIEQEEPAYRHDGWCASCQTRVDDFFYVPPGARHVRFLLEMRVSPPWDVHDTHIDVGTGARYHGASHLLYHNGTADVVVRNPEGEVMMSRSIPLNLTNTGQPAAHHPVSLYDGRWAATPGSWSVEMTFDQFPATLHARAYVRLVEWQDAF